MFLAVVVGSSLAVLGYVEVRRLLCAALDDRYGEWARFWWQARQSSAAGFSRKLDFAVAFFFCHGVHDLWRLVSLLIFDLFVVFAILAPFWRSVFFEDFHPAAAVTLGLVGVSVFLYSRLRRGLVLCKLHEWSQKTGRCERCGEPYLEPEPAGRLSWHGLWQRRLARLTEAVTDK